MSLQPTYEELKRNNMADDKVLFGGLQPTYEELKLGHMIQKIGIPGSLQPTYEELKHSGFDDFSDGINGFIAYL